MLKWRFAQIQINISIYFIIVKKTSHVHKQMKPFFFFAALLLHEHPENVVTLGIEVTTQKNYTAHDLHLN